MTGKERYSRMLRRALSGFVALVLYGAGLLEPAQAQVEFGNPLRVGTSDPIVNEFGQPLPGNYQSPGALVVVYHAPSQVVHPPDTAGNPHPDNPPLSGGETRIGRLTLRTDQPAMFGLALPESIRPADGTPLFVRVFNRESIEASSFYGDSEVFVVNDETTFKVIIPATNIPLDDADDDGDGLHNSWEKSFGTDPNNPDTSGSGMTDYEAVLAGLDPLDPNAVLDLTVTEQDISRVILRWPSRPGNLYQVEYTDRLGVDNFTPISDPFMADDAFSEFDVAPWLTHYTNRYFRLILYPMPLD